VNVTLWDVMTLGFEEALKKGAGDGPSRDDVDRFFAMQKGIPPQ
jgi:hypothetical protein